MMTSDLSVEAFEAREAKAHLNETYAVVIQGQNTQNKSRCARFSTMVAQNPFSSLDGAQAYARFRRSPRRKTHAIVAASMMLKPHSK